jgi:hypothetical protein
LSIRLVQDAIGAGKRSAAGAAGRRPQAWDGCAGHCRPCCGRRDSLRPDPADPAGALAAVIAEARMPRRRFARRPEPLDLGIGRGEASFTWYPELLHGLLPLPGPFPLRRADSGGSGGRPEYRQHAHCDLHDENYDSAVVRQGHGTSFSPVARDRSRSVAAWLRGDDDCCGRPGSSVRAFASGMGPPGGSSSRSGTLWAAAGSAGPQGCAEGRAERALAVRQVLRLAVLPGWEDGTVGCHL